MRKPKVTKGSGQKFGLAMSFFALLISFIGLYKSTVYQRDIILIAAAPSRFSLGMNPATPEVDIYQYRATVLVMNRGNTEVAVVGVENWLAMQSKLPQSHGDCRENLVGWSSSEARDFKPFVIAAGSTVAVDLASRTKTPP